MNNAYPNGTERSLTAGRHRFQMTYAFSGRGWDAVELVWTPPGGVRQVVPPSAFWGPEP